MQRVQRYIESNNITFLIQILEGKRLIALITINNKQLVTTYSLSLYILDKVLQLCKTKFIYYLAILTNFYSLILRVIILGLVIVLCLKDKEKQNRLLYRVNTSNQRYLLIITRLNTKQLKTSLRGCYYLNKLSNVYLEASLVKVINIFVQNSILSLNVMYKIKLEPNNSQVATENSLVISLSY